MTGEMTVAMTHRVRLLTDLGDLVVEVYADRAPQSAGAFLRYVTEGRYQGARFVRAVRPDNDHGTPPISVIQAAVADSDGPRLNVEHESTVMTEIRHVNGVVSLGRREPGTGTPAHFFICLGDQPALDYGGQRNPDGQGFAAFGRVIDGMETVRRIHDQPTLLDAPDPYHKGQIIAEPIEIRSARLDPTGSAQSPQIDTVIATFARALQEAAPSVAV